MARGIIYHIETEPSSIRSMSECDFYGKLDELCIDCVLDRNPVESIQDLENLKERLEKAGFPLKTHPGKNTGLRIQPMGKETLDGCRQSWFREKFEQMKTLAETVTLQEFATDTLAVYELQNTIEDQHSDAVYDGNCVHAMDGFIRKLEPGMEYFIAENTVLMH